MQSLEVSLETVTPLFLGGADPRGEPELRASSVRGALRFWLRALLGGIIGDSPDKLDALRQAESAVFGSTKLGASPVVIRLTGEIQAQDYRPLLHNPNKLFTIKGITPGKLLNLTLAPRPPYCSIPEVVCGAFLLFLLFGGLGKRSRRGFGSFVARSFSEGFAVSLPDYSTANGYSERLSSLVNKAMDLGRSHLRKLGLSSGTLSNPPRFAVLHDQHAKILFCKKSFGSWEDAMKSFWKVLRSDPYRDNRVFGFAGNAGRQASPLHLRIVKLGQNYHLLITAFRVHFAGQQPSWGVMQEFLNESKEKLNGEWVFGGDRKWE